MSPPKHIRLELNQLMINSYGPGNALIGEITYHHILIWRNQVHTPVKIFGIEKIQTLTADRKFIGFKWFNWVIENKIPFSIRVRHNFKVISFKGNKFSIKELFRNLRRGETRILSGRRKIRGVWLHIISNKLHGGTYFDYRDKPYAGSSP